MSRQVETLRPVQRLCYPFFCARSVPSPSSQTPTPTHFGKYSRPRTLSTGDLKGLHGIGAAEIANHPALEQLIEALEAHTKKAYASEVLRCLLHRKPITVSTLQSVRRCLRPLPMSEVTRFLVSWTQNGQREGGR